MFEISMEEMSEASVEPVVIVCTGRQRQVHGFSFLCASFVIQA